MPKTYNDETSVVPAPVFKASQWNDAKSMCRTLQDFSRRVTTLLGQTRTLGIDNRDMALENAAQVTKSNSNIDGLGTTVASHSITLASHTQSIAQNVADIAELKRYAWFMGH